MRRTWLIYKKYKTLNTGHTCSFTLTGCSFLADSFLGLVTALPNTSLPLEISNFSLETSMLEVHDFNTGHSCTTRTSSISTLST